MAATEPKTSADIARAAIEAARKAIAEGETILRRTREQLKLRADNVGPGPRERAWRRGEFMKPPESEPDPDYYLTEADKVNIHAVGAMMKIAQATKRPGMRKAALRTVGQHLQRIRNVQGRDWTTFAEIVRRECGFRKSLAYEIIKDFGEKAPKIERAEDQNG